MGTTDLPAMKLAALVGAPAVPDGLALGPGVGLAPVVGLAPGDEPGLPVGPFDVPGLTSSNDTKGLGPGRPELFVIEASPAPTPMATTARATSTTSRVDRPSIAQSAPGPSAGGSFGPAGVSLR